MKTSLGFITMELEYKRIMLNLKNTELEKLKVKMDELQARYKYELELRNELFNLLFSGPKKISGSNSDEKMGEIEENLVNKEERVVNRAELRSKSEEGESCNEKRREQIEEGVDHGQEVMKRRWLEGYGSEGAIDYIGAEGYDEEYNWEFEGVRLPMDNVSIAQLRLNKDLAMLRYYSMKSSIENMKSDIEVLRKVLIYFKDEIQEVQGNKKGYKWLN